MRINRPMFRKALWLTCCMSCLTAFSPSTFAQVPSPAENVQTTTVIDTQQNSETEEQQEQQRQGQSQQEVENERETDGRRSRVKRLEESEWAQPRAWLGIGLKEVSGDLAAYLGHTSGVLVETVFPDSPAASAELKVGDLITKINGEAVASPQALIEGLSKLDPSPSGADGRKDRSNRTQKKNDQQAKGQPQEKADNDAKDQERQETVQEKVTFSPVKLTLMRQGKQMTVEVTPAERPESAASPVADLDLPADVKIPDLDNMLRGLKSQSPHTFFRFGPPSHVPPPGDLRTEQHVVNLVIVIEDASGQSTEVRIDRIGRERPKITVKEGDKTREISEEEVEQLPAKVREAVQQALVQQEKALSAERSRGSDMRERIEAEIREQMERGRRDFREGARQRMEANRRMHEQLEHRPDAQSHITIFSPEELRQLGQSAQELAAKYHEMAEEMAVRGVEQVRELATMPEELKELRVQVDELKKQVEELKAQTKAKDR